jgi:hypothetical protein
MKAMSKTVQVKAGSDALMHLKERFATWRAERQRGMRIPPELWAAAVELVPVHGTYRVVRELNLDYDSLKHRVTQAGKVASTEPAPRFVELFAPGLSPAPSAQSECVVELTKAGGAKMQVVLCGQGLLTLPALCAAFLEPP